MAFISTSRRCVFEYGTHHATMWREHLCIGSDLWYRHLSSCSPVVLFCGERCSPNENYKYSFPFPVSSHFLPKSILYIQTHIFKLQNVLELPQLFATQNLWGGFLHLISYTTGLMSYHSLSFLIVSNGQTKEVPKSNELPRFGKNFQDGLGTPPSLRSWKTYICHF